MATVLILIMALSAYAGKVELTTYYPARYGEYKDISTYTLKIGEGNTNTPADSMINFKGISPTSPATDPEGVNDGDLYYNTQTAGSHKFRYFDSSVTNGGAWKDLGGGGVTVAEAGVFVAATAKGSRQVTIPASDWKQLIIVTLHHHAYLYKSGGAIICYDVGMASGFLPFNSTLDTDFDAQYMCATNPNDCLEFKRNDAGDVILNVGMAQDGYWIKQK